MDNKSYIIAIIFLLTSLCANALDWHDRLVSELMEYPDVTKTVVVERNRATHKIEKAYYKFEFPTKTGIAEKIRTELMKHSGKALKLSIDGDVILMQIKDAPSSYYSYKLSKQKNKSQFLISVSPNINPVSLIEGDKDMKRLVDDFVNFKVSAGTDFLSLFQEIKSDLPGNGGKFMASVDYDNMIIMSLKSDNPKGLKNKTDVILLRKK